MNLIFVKTNSLNTDFKRLVAKLDKELSIRDGEDHDFYHQFNGIDQLEFVMLAYIGDEAIGCGALKLFATDTIEVKRMYALDNFRGQRIATKLLIELEHWAQELNFKNIVLETGLRNPEAIAVYRRSGYVRIENYEQYAGIEGSVCFGKKLV